MGILVADAVAKPVREFPGKGKLVLVDDLQLRSGGCATNTGNALGKLGIDTAVIGKVGDDGFGDFLIKTIDSFGVDIRGIKRDPSTNTSATLVMVDEDGERSFIHYLGANAQFTEEDVDFSLIEGAKILHVAGALLLPRFDGEPAARVMKRGKEMGITTSLDTAWDSTGRWMKVLEPCLRYTDIFLPSIEEARMLTGEEEPARIAGKLLDYGVRIVGLKMGARGCYVRTREEEFMLPAFKVKAVDATGAGDSFVAGFLAGVVKGWNLRDCAALGNAVGACSVSAIGASTGILPWDKTMDFMREQGYSLPL